LRAAAFPLGVFATSRVVVVGALLAATRIQGTITKAALLTDLTKWDGDWYLSIARDGYPHHLPEVAGKATASNIAFFPLYPLTIRAVHAVTPLSYKSAAVVVANVFAATAVVLLWF